MGLLAVVRSAMVEAHADPAKMPDGDALAAAITNEVIATLQDEAVRREVYGIVTEQLDEISTMEVHYVLDALDSILRGE